jgi:hypothetical protein
MNPLTCQAAVYSMASGIRGPRDGPPGPPHRGTVECVAYPKRLRVIRPPLGEYHSPSAVSSVTQNCHPRAASFCPSPLPGGGGRSQRAIGAPWRYLPSVSGFAVALRSPLPPGDAGGPVLSPSGGTACGGTAESPQLDAASGEIAPIEGA